MIRIFLCYAGEGSWVFTRLLLSSTKIFLNVIIPEQNCLSKHLNNKKQHHKKMHKERHLARKPLQLKVRE